MKKWKKVFAAAVIVSMLASFLPAAAYAEGGAGTDGSSVETEVQTDIAAETSGEGQAETPVPDAPQDAQALSGTGSEENIGENSGENQSAEENAGNEAEAQSSGTKEGAPDSRKEQDGQPQDPADTEITETGETAAEETEEKREAEEESTFEETGFFGVNAADNNGTVVNAWYDSTNGVYVLFLTNACSIPALAVNITGVRMETTSRGILDEKTNVLTGAFASSGDAVTLTAPDGTKYNLKVMQSGLPSLNITLNGTDLGTIHANGKDAKYAGNDLILTDASGAVYLQQGDVEIKGRGNTTWDRSDKKPYQIKFSKKQSVLGMGKAKKWVLLANAFDDSLIRNQVAFHMAEGLGMTYVPDSENIDLWIDGEYRGAYTIGEKIEIGGSRLDLTSPTGVLVEKDDAYYREESDWFYDSYFDSYFALKEAVDEDTAGVAQTGLRQFNNKLDQLYRYLFGTSPSSVTIAGLQRYMDVSDAAKWYLVNEYTGNFETDATGWYWYMDGPDDVLHMGPVWDFDRSLGNSEIWNGAGDMFLKDHTEFFRRLTGCPAFVQYLQNMYAANAGMIQALGSYAVSLGSRISASADMNYTRWNYLGKANLKDALKPYASSYSKALSNVSAWLSNRYSAFGSRLASGAVNTVYTAEYDEKTGGILARVSGTGGYSEITIAFWSKENGQDDLRWYTAAKDAYQTASVSLWPGMHKGTGVYYADAYGTVNGKKHFIGSKAVTVSSYPEVSVSVDKKEDNNVLSAAVKNAYGYTTVKAAVWGKTNGQNDLKWYTMTGSGSGGYQAACDLLEHGETGLYYIDFYGVYQGKSYYLGGKTVTVEALLKPAVTVTTLSEGQSVKAVLTNAADYTDVRFAVWGKENGQNDLKWYNGTKDSSGRWSAVVDLFVHGETGTYNVHVYGTKGSGRKAVATTVFTVDELRKAAVDCRISGSGRVARITVSGTDPSYSALKIAIWSKKGGQDDLVWRSVRRNADGTWYVQEDLTAHGDEGLYYADVYGVRQQKVYAGGATFTVDEMRPPQLSAAQVSGNSRAAARLDNADEYTDVRFAVWTQVNGQDDLVWYRANLFADDAWRCSFDTRDHGGNGVYLIDAWGVKNGKNSYIATETITLKPYDDPQVLAGSNEDGSAIHISFRESFGYDAVKAAVWCETGGQNDLVWYTMKANDGGEWTADLNPCNHGETGRYRIHVYGTGGGKTFFAGETSLNVSRLASPVLTVTQNGTNLAIGLENKGNSPKIKFAVWTKENGQDDLVWYAAEKNEAGTWCCTVSTKKHGNGLYYIDAYSEIGSKKQFVISGTFTPAA